MINGFTPQKNRHTNLDMGKPQNWDEKTQGKCHSLPVAKTPQGYASWWKMSFMMRLKFLFGGHSIRLEILTPIHPVISICLEADKENK